MSELVEERMQLNRDLRRAMDAGELALHYQPVLRATSMQCVGVEALARWNHPELGWIPPAKFIPLAEDSGLILPLGEWVLREACTRLQAWAAAGMVLDFVSVNVSGRQVAKPGFVELVQRILSETGCPPQRVMLELTESYVMHESASSVRVLEELRQLGFGLAIDDFSTGYSSLAYLNRLPVTKLKLDQSFVRDIPADPNGVAIARSVLRLGEILGLEVVAEGVETAEQHEFIRAEGCSFSQGYLYSRPLPQPELEEFLRGHRAPVAAPA
jgi:two-component system CheB/CheR fusion protein